MPVISREPSPLSPWKDQANRDNRDDSPPVLPGLAIASWQARQHQRSARARQDAKLVSRIRTNHQQSRGIYGVPRVYAELTLGQRMRCSRIRVARLMRLAGLAGVHRRRLRGCTRPNERREPQPDLVRRDFTPSGPNRLWAADLTQHPTGEGWLYLATVLDVFSRRVAGRAMGARAETELVLSALDMAVWNRGPQPGVIHHSDHGAFTTRLRVAGILGSMGTVGDALDNAVAESFFATLQTELLDRDQWPTRRALTTTSRASATGRDGTRLWGS